MSKRIYQLVIRGDGGALTRGAFPEFDVDIRGPTTVLRGVVSDAAAFEETVARLHGLGLELLEVRNLGDPDAGPKSQHAKPEQ